LIRSANGTWNFSSIGRRPASGAVADAASGISRSFATELPVLTISGIVIEDGRAVVARLPALGQPSVYEHLNLGVRHFSLDSRFPFELSADLPAGGMSMSLASSAR